MLQRLIKDQGPYGQQRFEYDEVGNRLSQHYAQGNTTETTDESEGSDENLTRYHYAPASNRLLATSEKDIVLDPMGNTLQESNDLQHAYGYNAQNRISEYTKDGQLKARYHYNALGQRIHKAAIKSDGSEQHTLFHYGQQGQLLGETNLDKSSITEQAQNIVWLQMRPIVAIDTTQNEATHIAWLHSDHLLTARTATDANQRLVWRWHSDAFGVGEAESFAQTDQPQLTLNLRFPGQYHDEESGLYYNYFRTYDPNKGRYAQSDPIGLLGGINTFAYGHSSPLSTLDFYGLCSSQAEERPYDSTDPNYHRYDVRSAICQIDAVCTMASVALANRMHPAPGMLSNTTPVLNGQISNAQMGYGGDWDNFGPVMHTVSADGLTVRNTTLDGHLLAPGYVERTVFRDGDTIYIRTFGEGIGPLGAANEFFAPALWNGVVDSHVRYRVNLGYRK